MSLRLANGQLEHGVLEFAIFVLGITVKHITG